MVTSTFIVEIQKMAGKRIKWKMKVTVLKIEQLFYTRQTLQQTN